MQKAKKKDMVIGKWLLVIGSVTPAVICLPTPVRRRYLCAYKAPFTTVERALQIRPFMQNKANFPESQMNVNEVLTRDYVNKTLGEHGKNEPKTNPIKANQSQLKPILCQNKPNSNPNKPNFKRRNYS